jgi:hypothetical protein
MLQRCEILVSRSSFYTCVQGARDEIVYECAMDLLELLEVFLRRGGSRGRKDLGGPAGGDVVVGELGEEGKRYDGQG